MEWLAMALALGEARKALSADALFRSLRFHFGSVGARQMVREGDYWCQFIFR